MAGNCGRLAAANAAEPAPAITGQPQSAALTAGQRLVLSVTATGSGLTYQWFKDGTALGGATGPTFTIASSEVSDTGSYTVTAANRHGTATSQPAGVTVTAAASGVGGAASPAAAAGGASSGSGAFDAGSALALALLLAIRTRSARA